MFADLTNTKSQPPVDAIRRSSSRLTQAPRHQAGDSPVSLVAMLSLLFAAIGAGRILNTGLKYYIFPEAERRSYFECNQQPPVTPVVSKEGATADQKAQIDSLLRDYENWKQNQSGDNCIKPARQNNIIDALTMVIIALPRLLLHWKLIRREKKEKDE